MILLSNNVDHQVLNYLCFYAKFHIYINKQHEKNNPDFLIFLQNFVYTLKREITILERNNRKKELKNALSVLLDALSP